MSPSRAGTVCRGLPAELVVLPAVTLLTYALARTIVFAEAA